MSARKLFGTDGIRGVANEHPMTADLALCLGKALGVYFKKISSKPRIVIGKDTRRSGYMLETALTAGLTSVGAKVYLLGPLPTPSVAYHIRGLRAHGGVMISASHNPYQDNGLKVFKEDGYKLDDVAEKEIEDLMFNEAALKAQKASSLTLGRAERVDDAAGRYLVNLKSIFSRDFDLEGLKIVFDAANGAAYDAGPRLLIELGAYVVRHACHPDGYNINKDCAQENPKVLGDLVRHHKADLGIAVDGDADRVLISDEKGNLLSGEHFMYEMACFLKSEGRLQSNALVTTQMANMGLEAALKSQKIECYRANVGDRYVTQMLKEKSAIFGGETSGHFIFLDQNTTADGLFSGLEILNLLRQQGRKASELGKSFELFPQKLVSIRVKEKKPIDQIKGLESASSEIERKYEGKGRINIRYSGTEMLMRIMLEGPSEKDIERDIATLSKIVEQDLG